MNDKQLHVIVQAGGRGTRLRHHTWNKPKCLVSYMGRPLLYHVFSAFPEAKFLLIGDYKYEMLSKYLGSNPPKVQYEIIKAEGKGTCSGIAEALSRIDGDCPLLLLWSDLIFGQKLELDKKSSLPVIYTTSRFTCRWMVTQRGSLIERASAEHGVPGVFFFSSAGMLEAPPENGEFLKWFQKRRFPFAVRPLEKVEEVGDFLKLKKRKDSVSRFFNQVVFHKDSVEKRAVVDDFEELHRREIDWYKQARKLGFKRIPAIRQEKPFIMERIQGVHAYQLDDLNQREQRVLMANYLDSLSELHSLGEAPCIESEVHSVYIDKTMKRVAGVSELIPHFDKPEITVNGKKCRNIFFSDSAEAFLGQRYSMLVPDRFNPIHGDPTFSNSMVDDCMRVWYFDPRGYFAQKGIMGDAMYDFAKLYYSAVGGYDAFNHHQFKLYVDDHVVEVVMDSPSISKVAEEMFTEVFPKKASVIRYLHGLLWLSLSGYVLDHVDSIMASFYLGLYWLEDAENKL